MNRNSTRGFCLLALFVCASFSKTFSQDGKIDSSFGTNGRVWDPQADFVRSGVKLTPRILVMSDGKILHLSNTSSGLLMVRYLPDGSIDASFGSGGMKTIPSVNIYDAVLLPDQKFLVLSSNYTVRRFTSAGNLDSTFGGDGIASLQITGNAASLAVQADGKIVVSGSGSLAGDPAFTTVRYNADGAIDNTFDGDGIAQFNFNSGIDYASAVAVQADGKIVVAGIVTNFITVVNGTPVFSNQDDVGVIRYLSDGTIDTDFGVGGKVNFITGTLYEEISRVLIQTDGKIVVAGDQYFWGDPDQTYMFADRFLSNGSLDAAFNGGSVSLPASGKFTSTDAALQADGKVLVAGYNPCTFCNPGFQDFIVFRLLNNGNSDAVWGFSYLPTSLSTYSIEWGNSLASQGNNLLLGGLASTNSDPYKALLIRVNNSSPIISRNPITFYRDQDGDGYGTSESSIAYMAPAGYAVSTGDCNDTDASIHPGAAEAMDGKDNNCNGIVDDQPYVTIPAKIEAENWSNVSGVQTENTSDAGGGQNVGYIDNGDWMEYNISVPAAGQYNLLLRLASTSGTNAQLQIQKGSMVLATVNVPNTGGFQNWQTVPVTVNLPAGNYAVRIANTGYAYWNINWLQFTGQGTTIPAKIEAENWTTMNGVQTEATSDAGGGQNVGYIDYGDWMEYAIVAPHDGMYTLNLRLASPAASYSHLDVRSGETTLASIDVPNTGGFQTWQTVPVTVHLTEGYQVVRIVNTGYSYWNINWLEFAEPSSMMIVGKGQNRTSPLSQAAALNIYPNPINQDFVLELNNSLQGSVKVNVVNSAGRIERTFSINKSSEISKHNLSLYGLAGGQYILQVQMKGFIETKKILKL